VRKGENLRHHTTQRKRLLEHVCEIVPFETMELRNCARVSVVVEQWFDCLPTVSKAKKKLSTEVGPSAGPEKKKNFGK
jgi:hypothetical protein